MSSEIMSMIESETIADQRICDDRVIGDGAENSMVRAENSKGVQGCASWNQSHI